MTRKRPLSVKYMGSKNNLMKRIFFFYVDGFRSMSDWGRKVWIIIIIKLFIMFAILRVFFFQGFLNRNYDNDRQRSEHVINQLINPSDIHDR